MLHQYTRAVKILNKQRNRFYLHSSTEIFVITVVSKPDHIIYQNLLKTGQNGKTYIAILCSLLGHYQYFGGTCRQKVIGQSYEQTDGITMDSLLSHHAGLQKHSTGQPTTLLVLVCQQYICDVAQWTRKAE
jgi:hypothetical protein